MIEDRASPHGDGVAYLTIGREPCLNMVRCGGILVIGIVATITVRSQPCKGPGVVTVITSYGRVPAGQRKYGVIEAIGRHPRRDGMTQLTVRREPSLRMIRIRGVLEIGTVTTVTVRRQACKDPGAVTFIAVYGRVPAG